ncbi:MAG: hypothetical protein JW840_02985 [Candidatus Thermoplasmatota archaeon]|nr:hypothetical protein [Candidatus Thermoplasmatota archaeon]
MKKGCQWTLKSGENCQRKTTKDNPYLCEYHKQLLIDALSLPETHDKK